jgi:hypothetical protein
MSWMILMHEAIQEARYLAVYDRSATNRVRAAGEAVNDINIQSKAKGREKAVTTFRHN